MTKYNKLAEFVRFTVCAVVNYCILYAFIYALCSILGYDPMTETLAVLTLAIMNLLAIYDIKKDL